MKPVALMCWLTRLVTPPNGVILDPFTGSGSTGIAARLEKFRFIGIEKEHEYAVIARMRIAASHMYVDKPDKRSTVKQQAVQKPRRTLFQPSKNIGGSQRKARKDEHMLHTRM